MVTAEAEVIRPKGHDVTDELRERGADGLQEVLDNNSEPYRRDGGGRAGKGPEVY